jgi:hypothetical protein
MWHFVDVRLYFERAKSDLGITGCKYCAAYHITSRSAPTFEMGGNPRYDMSLFISLSLFVHPDIEPSKSRSYIRFESLLSGF